MKSINNIKNLLERFRNLKPSDTYVKEVFIDVVKELLSVEIYKEEIKVQNSLIFLNVHPSLKTELFLHKNKILTILKERLDKHTVTNII